MSRDSSDRHARLTASGNRSIMRPIWKGSITFGLVNVPAALYSAEQRSDLRLHLLDSRDRSRVRYERVNAETGEEVPWDDITKGYEYDDGSYVIIDKDELREAAPEATRTIEIQSFVNLDEIDPAYFDKPYYLEPDTNGKKGYALLHRVLSESGRAGIARVVIRTRQYIAAMFPRGDALLLMLLRYQQELRSPDSLDLPDKKARNAVSDQELKMAQTLVDSMETEWDPSEHHDEYRAALMRWIEQKIKAGDIERAPGAPEPEEPASKRGTRDIMDALKKSVEHVGGRRRRAAGEAKKKTKSAKKRSSKATSAKTKGKRSTSKRSSTGKTSSGTSPKKSKSRSTSGR
jgi:DNA end-binding protein Ku